MPLLTTRTLSLVALTALTLAGCGKKSGPPNVGLKKVNDAFVSAGFKLDSFQPADGTGMGATSCTAGTLDGVEALVCEFPDTPGAPAKKAAEDWVGTAVTGTVLVRGRALLGLADRRRVDPNGKTIHKITQAFQKLD